MGSTAVPGMVAKPIIDLNSVIEASALPETREQLGSLGYVHEGGISESPVARCSNCGPGRCLSFRCITSMSAKGRAEALHSHLAFRDFLRGHPEWRDRLSRHKRELATQHGNDKERYIEGKAAMVEAITALALAEGQARGRYRT